MKHFKHIEFIHFIWLFHKKKRTGITTSQAFHLIEMFLHQFYIVQREAWKRSWIDNGFSRHIVAYIIIIVMIGIWTTPQKCVIFTKIALMWFRVGETEWFGWDCSCGIIFKHIGRYACIWNMIDLYALAEWCSYFYLRESGCVRLSIQAVWLHLHVNKWNKTTKYEHKRTRAYFPKVCVCVCAAHSLEDILQFNLFTGEQNMFIVNTTTVRIREV